MHFSINSGAPATISGVESAIEQIGWRGDFPMEKLNALLDELHRYSKLMNLTAHFSAEATIKKHLYESALLAAIVGDNFSGNAADLGTGNGFPGLALAAMLTRASFTLIEASENRVAFLENAIAAMELRNVKIEIVFLKKAPEDLKNRFDLICHRAFAKPEIVFRLALEIGKPRHLLAGFGIGVLESKCYAEFGYELTGSIKYINAANKRDSIYTLVNAD